MRTETWARRGYYVFGVFMASTPHFKHQKMNGMMIDETKMIDE